MRITFEDRLVRRQVNERISFSLVARFFDDSTENWTATTPTTVKYRIDTADNCPVRDWTNATPGTSATLSISSSDNQIYNDGNTLERRIVTVKADDGLSTQYSETFHWDVKNLNGQS